jgi:hypothetical protein
MLYNKQTSWMALELKQWYQLNLEKSLTNSFF